MAAPSSFAKSQKRRLRRHRGHLVRDIEHLQQAIQTEIEAGLDEGDAGVFTQEANFSSLTTLEERLFELDQALSAIDLGTYGICTRCGEPIAAPRLAAKPEAQYCLACQKVVESASRVST